MRIETKEQLTAHLLSGNDYNSPVYLYEAIGHCKSIYEVKIFHPREAHIGYPLNMPEDAFLYYKNQYGWTKCSLGDRHLNGEQDYNDNWWFTTRESAEEYINPKPKQFEVGAVYIYKNRSIECVLVGENTAVFTGFPDTEFLSLNVNKLILGEAKKI